MPPVGVGVDAVPGPVLVPADLALCSCTQAFEPWHDLLSIIGG